MLLTLTAALLTPAASAAPNLETVLRLPPREAGEIVLKGRDHRMIETVERPQVRTLQPPGLVQLHLIERAVPGAGGCLRRRWAASFQHAPEARETTARFADAWAASEVALARPSGCADARFAHVNPGLPAEEALAALRRLDAIRGGRARVSFACQDYTGSRLCERPDAIPRELSLLPAWGVTRNEGMIELWLGRPGQTVTAVSYSAAAPDKVSIRREFPPPS